MPSISKSGFTWKARPENSSPPSLVAIRALPSSFRAVLRPMGATAATPSLVGSSLSVTVRPAIPGVGGFIRQMGASFSTFWVVRRAVKSTRFISSTGRSLWASLG